MNMCQIAKCPLTVYSVKTLVQKKIKIPDFENSTTLKLKVYFFEEHIAHGTLVVRSNVWDPLV